MEQCLGNNIFTSNCHSWANNNPTKARALRRSYCSGDRINTQQCRSWLNQPSSWGNNDMAMRYFCQQQSNDQLCRCLASDVSSPTLHDQQCANTNAYRTAEMLALQSAKPLTKKMENSKSIEEKLIPSIDTGIVFIELVFFVLIIAAFIISIVLMSKYPKIVSEEF